jgi:hypothetical protein
MTAFYQSLISFLQQELPAVAEAIEQVESLPEQIRLQQIERMMRELLDYAISQDRKG